jgi:hypothetical protein
MKVSRSLYVNGVRIDALTFFAEANWRDMTIHVPLNPGKTNTITLKNDTGSAVDVQFDRMTLDGEYPRMIPNPPLPASWKADKADLPIKKVTKVLLPDLIVTEVHWSPEEPKPGDKVIFSATVKNIGVATTPEGTVLGVLFNVVEDGSYVWSDNDTHALAPGESVTVTATGGINNISVWTAKQGKHTLRAVVDDSGRLDESDRSNNSLNTTFEVQ